MRVRLRDVLDGDDALQVQEDETMGSSVTEATATAKVGEAFSQTFEYYYEIDESDNLDAIDFQSIKTYIGDSAEANSLTTYNGLTVVSESGSNNADFTRISISVTVSGTPTSVGVVYVNSHITSLEVSGMSDSFTVTSGCHARISVESESGAACNVTFRIGDSNRIHAHNDTKDPIRTSDFTESYPQGAALNLASYEAIKYNSGSTTYQHSGWACSDGKTYGPSDTVTIQKDITLTPVFDSYSSGDVGDKSYIVTLDTNGGYATENQFFIRNGEKYSQLPSRVTWSDEIVGEKLRKYTFTGWYTSPSGGTRIYPSDTAENITSNFTLYAQRTYKDVDLMSGEDIPTEGNGAWTQPISRSRFRVQMSDSTGSDYFDLMYTDDKGRTRSCISSMKVVGGPEEPFEMVQLVIPKKRLYYVASQLAEANGILAGVTKVVLNDALGRGVFTVTKCKYSGKRFTITAYCDAERFRGSTIQGGSLTGTPRSILATILATRADYGIQVSYLDMDPVSRTSNEYEGVLTFEQDTNLWYALQVCAMLMGCRIWFADDTMHVRNCTRRVLNRVSDGAEDLDLYPSSESDPMYGRTAGEVELGDEGADTVVNSVSVRCSYLNPETGEGRGSYNMGPYYENGGDRESSSSVAKFGERTEALTIPELTYTVDTNEETGISTRASEAAEAFARNYIEYLKEPQQSITFELKEIQRTADGKGYEWFPYFDEPTMLDTLVDEPDEIVLSNESVCDSGTLPQKLMLSSHTRRYPECTTTYSFGIMKSVSLSDSTSRILDALNKG